MATRVCAAFLMAAAAALSALPGCGSGLPPLVPVSGTVTVNGRPLEDGFLYFKTIETGFLERADIKDGKFEGKAHVGSRRVEVYATRPKRVTIDGKEVDVPDNFIAPAFNTESTLVAEVTPAGPNQFTFDVKKK